MFIVYITEAHASDVWNIGLSAGTINESHKNINDRIKCAKKFQETFKMNVPIYCDSMKDDFETIYAGWPFRYFVIKDSKLIKIGSPEDSHFDLTILFDFLSKL
jgi:Iodothyronine deiodinase.